MGREQPQLDNDKRQLINDAKKKGAWQAKLAYAQYVYNLKMLDQSSLAEGFLVEQAKQYLREIINDSNYNAYKREAEILLHKFQQDDINNLAIALAINSYESTYNHSQRFTKEKTAAWPYSPEAYYKALRFKKDKSLIENTEYSSKLKLLLKSDELTDTLRAKIYFQLVRVNIEEASINGRHPNIKEAKHYCDKLITDPALKDMDKAQAAKQINKIIKASEKTDKYGFEKYIERSFTAGQGISTKFFNYLGLAVGNALDISMFMFPKFISMANSSVGYKNAKDFFIDQGWAKLFKDLGERIGKYTIGLVTGAIGAAIGLATYPVVYKYKKSDDLITLSKEIINLESDKKDSFANGSNKSLKKIFDHKNPEHKYGEYTRENTITSTPVNTSLPDNAPNAYGRVFAKPSVAPSYPLQSTVQASAPPYPSLTKS